MLIFFTPYFAAPMTTTMNTTGVDTANNTSEIEIPVDVTTTAIPFEMWWTKAPKASEEPNKNQQPITGKPETPSMYKLGYLEKSKQHNPSYTQSVIFIYLSCFIILRYGRFGVV